MKKLVCGVCVLAMTMNFAACGVIPPKGPFTQTEIRAELGDTVSLPDIGQDYSAKVIDEKGEEVRVQYGAFIPKVGTYTIIADVEGTEYKIKVVCEDSIAPTVMFEKHLIDVSEGSTVTIPNYKTEDKAGIASRSVKVLDADGTNVEIQGNGFVAESGVYTVVATAVDNSGNTASDTAQIIVHKEFYDTSLEKGELASFNSADYIAIMYSVDGQDGFTASVGDGVMNLSTTAEYGDVASTIKIPVRDFDFSKTGMVKVRVKTDKAVDYIKILGTNNDLEAGAVYYPTPAKWYDVEVDPVLLGYSYADSLTIVARSLGGATISVDSITCTENKTDADYNGVEDFKGETPLSRVYQTIYQNDLFYGYTGSIAGGNSSTFSIGEKYYYGEQTPVTVLKVQTRVRWDGFTYMLQQVEDVEKVASIAITLSLENSVTSIMLGIMHNDNKVSSYTKTFTSVAVDEQVTLTLSANDFRRYVDTELTGVYLMVSDVKCLGAVLNIESIKVVYKS